MFWSIALVSQWKIKTIITGIFARSKVDHVTGVHHSRYNISASLFILSTTSMTYYCVTLNVVRIHHSVGAKSLISCPYEYFVSYLFYRLFSSCVSCDKHSAVIVCCQLFVRKSISLATVMSYVAWWYMYSVRSKNIYLQILKKFYWYHLPWNERYTEDCFTPMMTSSNQNVFRVTGPFCGEFTGHRWIQRTKASDAERWCFFFFAPEYTVEWKIVKLVIWNAIAPIMTSL